ncbi:MAG TPA: type I DNA topoisomerase [bacterium]|nr:type I DNA topoisomerase [bacterium]HPL95232.1 type I DNA topoisomerase [bacterium]
MSKSLLIVESPTKAKTIGKFLGRDYKVVSSFGHVRDLPEKELGVDVDHDFTPHYIIPPKAKSTVTMLKKEAAKVKNIYFATDEDREGEAIAWHLHHLLTEESKKNNYNFSRIVFHEITEPAIKIALEKSRAIDINLVDAQQARRVLDRLVGYELSPFLWKKVAKGLSAGRVQSVAVRLIVEREREIRDFKPEEYWSIAVELTPVKKIDKFICQLVSVDNKKLEKFSLKNNGEAEKITTALKAASYLVEKISRKSFRRQPLPPFTTSTLQQEANNKLNFSSKQTMFLAQNLYEGIELGSAGHTGLITYMRTDAVNLSEIFLSEAHDFITKEWGAKYSSATPRVFSNKSKMAQEAHEAIRPTDINRRPEDVKPFLNINQYKLYNLIWCRSVATQMAEAEFDAVALDVVGLKDKHQYGLRASGSTLKFDGWLKVYGGVAKENILPALKEKEKLNLLQVFPEQHFTEPPARYSEASLIKKMEELGIGRPSTYAPTIATIEERGYITKEAKKLLPTDIAMVVNDLLVKHFPEIVDYQFTAEMEDKLDAVASGTAKWVPVLKKFYQPFKKNLTAKYESVKKGEIINEVTDEVCDKCGSQMIVKIGRYGKFLACSGFPKCKNIKNIKKEYDHENEGEKKEPEITDQKCEKCGSPMVKRAGKFGEFLACSTYPKCKNTKPLDYSSGVKCPDCKVGEMVARRTRSRRTFYACNRYPTCKFAVWSKPVADPDSKDGAGLKCPTCGSLLVEGAKGKIKCSKKECDYEK